MTKTQLYLSIGVPTLTVILAWLSNRLDINRRNDKLDTLGDALRAEMLAFRWEIERNLIVLHERVVKVETRQISKASALFL